MAGSVAGLLRHHRAAFLVSLRLPRQADYLHHDH